MWQLISPNGKIKIARTFLGYPASRSFIGTIEIPDQIFQTKNRSFADPMAFSNSSFYLAAVEIVPSNTSYDSSNRVVVFDFEHYKEWIVFADEGASIESIEWTTNALQMDVIIPGRGREERSWKPVNFALG